MEENKVAADQELKQKSREIVSKFFNICDAKNESSADITWLVQNIFVALVAVRDQARLPMISVDKFHCEGANCDDRKGSQ